MVVTLATTTSTPNPSCLIVNSHRDLIPNKRTIKATLLPRQNPHRSLTISKSSLCSGTAIATTVFSTLASDPAMAIQQLAEVPPGGDNRILAILLPIIPAVLWVLYNILGPALNQIKTMRSEKGILVGLGLGGGSAALHFLKVPNASASEGAVIGEVSSDDMSLLISVAVTLALLWAYYNIFEPALNQINKMRSS